MTTYYCADPHIEHEGILEITERAAAFGKDIQAHNWAILDGINSSVKFTDQLYILGDVVFKDEADWLRKIKCKNKHLIWGNHDKNRIGAMFKSARDVHDMQIGTAETGPHRVFLSHYPHAYWPASHRGSLHLYGHVHAEREATLDAAFPGRRSMDCGLDNAKRLLGTYRPFSEHEVIDILAAKPGHDFVEWYEQQRAARAAKAADLTPEEFVAQNTPGSFIRKPNVQQVAKKLSDFFMQNGNYGR